MSADGIGRIERAAGQNRLWARLCALLDVSFVAVLGAACVIEWLAWRANAPRPIFAALRHPFTAVALAGVLPHYLLWPGATKARDSLVFLPVALAAAALLAPLVGGDAWSRTLAALSTLGVFGLGGYLSAALFDTSSARRLQATIEAQRALVLPLAASMTPFGLWSTYTLNPVYDDHVFAFEEALGLQMSILGMRSFDMLAPLAALATACYIGLPIGLMVLAQARRRVSAPGIDVIQASVIAGACGFSLYFVAPVVGPLQAFSPPYPDALPSLSSLELGTLMAREDAPRNGMPSLHAVWALLICFNVGPLRQPARTALAVFACMNLWAAMSLRDTHWILDIVVAVPLAASIQIALAPGLVTTRKIVLALLSALTTLAWLWAVRDGTLLVGQSMAAAWVLVIATISLPLFAMRAVGRSPVQAATGPH